MLTQIDTSWLLMAVSTVAILSYIISLGLDALLRGDGFGPIGNALLITGGFFASIWIVNWRGIEFETLLQATATGVAGAFGLLIVLTVAKGLLNRM